MDIGPTIRRLLRCATDRDGALAEEANHAVDVSSAAKLTNSSVGEVEAAWEAAVSDSGTPTLMLVA